MTDSTVYSDIEIRILKCEAKGYPIELAIDNSRQHQGSYLPAEVVPWINGASPEQDGERLFNLLFSDPALQRAWARSRGQNAQRRIRLRIDAAAPELHTIPWELLRDADPAFTPQTLAADANTPFSRYLAGEWDPGQPVTERPIKMLVAIANPEGLDDYDLGQIDVARERKNIEAVLADVGDDQLSVTFLDDILSLPRLRAKLRNEVHLLHIVAHGSYNQRKQTASLFLADDENDVRLVKADELAALLNGLTQAPQLITLSSCETATRSPADAFRGFAPRLIQAGVPAVLAMQDLVPQKTAQAFAQTFYRNLLDHGQVDLASNEARATILAADLPGGSIPVLFSRLPQSLLFESALADTINSLDFPPPPEPARPPALTSTLR